MGIGTRQPIWKCIANLGDVNPIDYGGFFVYVDKTGDYCPEAELLEVPQEEDGQNSKYLVFRFSIDKCTFIDGILSDNKYHPEHSAWFATPEKERKARPQDNTYLSNIADCCGISTDDLIAMLTSENPCERASAYREIGSYHGFDNLDSYPLELSRAEVNKRYRTTFKQLKRGSK